MRPGPCGGQVPWSPSSAINLPPREVPRIFLSKARFTDDSREESAEQEAHAEAGEIGHMSGIEAALVRLTGALDQLEEAVEVAAAAGPADATEALRLQDEVQMLRSRAEEDARLRAEAAGAVREALRDLRGAMVRSTQSGEQANA